MAEFVVVLDAPNSMKTKTVQVYLEDDAGDHRQIRREDVPIAVDVATYVEEHFVQLWIESEPLADRVWDAYFEKQFRDLYREVVRAGVQAARGQLATLADVTLAMETELLTSDKAGAYSRLVTLATGATASQRDAFFLVTSFLVLNKFMSGD
jgi:hypothetical protein